MNRRNIRRWLLCLCMCIIVMAGLLVSCSVKVSVGKESTTTRATTETTTKETTEATTESTAEKETGEATSEATTTPTEATSEATTEATTEPTTEATTEATTKETKKETTKKPTETTPEPTEAAIDENGTFTSKDDVALYIHTYGHLPSNFVTKSEARNAGWEGGSLEDYFPGCSIGGDVFGNREGILPKKNGRTYYECDIDTMGKKSRGAKRIVFSNDGLIYYTEDHYETFTLLYGEE